MKKEDVTGLFVYLIIFALAIVFGLVVLREHFANAGLNQGMYLLYVLGSIIAGVVANALIYELAHILGAKMGKYNIMSVNILGLCFYRKDNKWRFKFGNYDGLTGETKIYPKNEKSNPVWYLMMGTILIAIEAVTIIVLFNLLKNNKSTINVAYFLLIVVMIGFMILLYNIMPLRLDTLTDGYRLRLVSNPKNKEAFNELLKAEYAISVGDTSYEMKTFVEITNFTAELNLNKVYLYLNQDKLSEAEELINLILNSENNIYNRVYIRAKAIQVYIEIMTKTLEEAKAYYEGVSLEDRKAISLDVSLESIRAYILMSGLLDNSKSETVLALEKVVKAYRKTNKSRLDTEVKLYNRALKKIIDVHPKWELDKYLLQEESTKQ